MPQRRMRVEIALIGGIVCFCCWCAYILVRMNSSVVAEQPAAQQNRPQSGPTAPSDQSSPGAARQQNHGGYPTFDPQVASSARVNSPPPPLPGGFYPAAMRAPPPIGSQAPPFAGSFQQTQPNPNQQRLPEANSPAVFYVNHPDSRAPHLQPSAYGQAPVWAGQQAAAGRWRPQPYFARPASPAPQPEPVDPTAADESLSGPTEEAVAGPEDAENEEGEDAAGAGDEQPPDNELEERAGERSFSENQSDATERDRHGRPVRVYQRHLVNGKPVKSSARDKQADFDSLVQEIDNQEQEQDQDQPDYDDAPDTGKETAGKPGTAESQQRKKRHYDRSRTGTKVTSAAKTKRPSRRKSLTAPAKKDMKQHRLSETLTARQWDDDSTLAKKESDKERSAAPTASEADDVSIGDEMEDAEQRELPTKITTVEDLDNLDKLSPVANGGLSRFPLESARRRRKRQIARELSARAQPSEPRLTMFSARLNENNTLVKSQLDEQHLPVEMRRRRKKRQTLQADQTGSSFGQRTGYQAISPNLSAVPYEPAAYDYPLQPPPVTGSQNGAFQVTISTNLDQQSPPAQQPAPVNQADYSSVTAQQNVATQPAGGQLMQTQLADLGRLPNLGGAQTQESPAPFGQIVARDWTHDNRPVSLKDADWPYDPNLVQPYDPARLVHKTIRRPEASESQKLKKKVIKKKKKKFKKSKMSDSKYKAAKAHKSKVKKGKMKKKKHKAKKKVLKKSKQFQGSTKGNKGQKGGGQQGSNKGAIYYKDRGFKKRGFKKAYRKLEAGDHKTYFDEFRDKDHKKKWKKFKDKHHYSQNKNWSGKEAKKYKNYDFKEHKDKKSGSGQWKKKESSKFRKDYKRKSSGGSGSKMEKKKKKSSDH